MAAIYEPHDGPGSLWSASRSLLRWVPITLDDDEEVLVGLVGGDADRRTLAGLMAHVGLNDAGLLVAELDGDGGRYVQLISDDCGVRIESVSDAFLDPGRSLTDEQVGALRRRGFAAPDDNHVNWYRFEDVFSATALADLVLGTLADTHGARAGDVVRVKVALAASSPESVRRTTDEGVALDFEAPNVAHVAEALALRMQESIDVVGIDRLFTTLEQPRWPYYAHLGSNLDGGLLTEVSGNFHLNPDDCLDDDQDKRLRALGWNPPVEDPSDAPETQTPNYTRVWPAPFDLRAACWHVALTLAAIYGLDPEDPILVDVALL